MVNEKEMESEPIKQVKNFIRQHTPLVIIGTADQEGSPHLAMESSIRWVRERTIEFESWFCQTTIANLRENSQAAIAVFDPKTQKGYQLLGQIESIREGAILNGYIAGEKPDEQAMPLQAYRIDITIEKILFFSTGPHSDSPLS